MQTDRPCLVRYSLLLHHDVVESAQRDVSPQDLECDWIRLESVDTPGVSDESTGEDAVVADICTHIDDDVAQDIQVKAIVGVPVEEMGLTDPAEIEYATRYSREIAKLPDNVEIRIPPNP